MSFKTQVALGKNTTLQKQLEDKYVEFKRSFKFSRRRLDVLEEECLTALYKLVVDNKQGKDGDKPNDNNNNTRANSRQTKSANPRLRRDSSCLGLTSPEATETHDQAKRSQTSTSGLNYHQSYSFIKDGLNIDQSRRDRFLRSKQQKENKEIEIRRGNVHWAGKKEVECRPKTASLIPESGHTNSSEDQINVPSRPFTAEPYNSRTSHGKLLNRGQTTQTLSQNSSQKGGLTPATQLHPNTGVVMIQTPEETEHKKVKVTRPGKQTVVSTRNCDTPDGESSPIAVRISITKLNDTENAAGKGREQIDRLRVVPRNYSAPEDELLPIEDDDKRHLETIMSETGDRVDRAHFSLSKSPRSTTRSVSRFNHAKTPTTEVKDIEETTASTQNFLSSYAKKSKLLGYVVKTRSSSAAPREKGKRTYRSPSITYQELVSIKANIKQQESRSRLLIQRSAKLTKYVDKLANASNVRSYLQSQNKKVKQV